MRSLCPGPRSLQGVVVFDNRAPAGYLAGTLCRACPTSATTCSSATPRAVLASRRRPSATGTSGGKIAAHRNPINGINGYRLLRKADLEVPAEEGCPVGED